MSEPLFFQDETSLHEHTPVLAPWKVLVVDDEPAVHDVTELTLGDFRFEGRGLELIRCLSAAQARETLARTPDVAVALLDVVMETDTAGLDLVKWIREEHGDPVVRIVVRTGQPGLAPKLEVVEAYDIHDYKEKTELTRKRLHMTMYSALRSYRDLVALRTSLSGLKRTIASTTLVAETNDLTSFSYAVADELSAVLSLPERPVERADLQIWLCNRRGDEHQYLGGPSGGRAPVLQSDQSLSRSARRAFGRALALADTCWGLDWFVGYHPAVEESLNLFYVRSRLDLTDVDLHLLRVFSANVSATYQNLLLKREVEETQKELVYLLGEAVERRSGETGAHVVRVGLTAGLLARAYGVDEREAELIAVAAPLHDAGKVAIPDEVLNKPGKLTSEEWATMKTHALIGAELLARSPRRVAQMGSLIAAQHHEKWDGSGYPRGLAGTDIHVAARATAIADVFDALLARRCYKEPWPLDLALDLLKRESGHHFEPRMVQLFLEHLDEILAIRADHLDGEGEHEQAA